ncbi:MAG: prepilin-type N-terminal cleavage/methylation domain-containing protein [Pseudomonadales bacterium]
MVGKNRWSIPDAVSGNASRGFTLIELMIVVAILAVISAIALPIYRGYVQTSTEGVLFNNVATIEVFQEDARLRTGAYVAGNYDVAGGDTGLAGPPLNWDPQDQDIAYNVVIVGGSYRITATHPSGVTLCRQFPEGVPCP